MFKSVLIANRGEIATRIIRTARRLGLRVIAVYSEADARALHVRMADEAHPIGPAEAARSYLNAGRIIAAAKASGADCIHPGYGFLSENADFAQTCADAGIVFVGPPPDAIRAMGLKGSAKALMEKASVPVVPGYHGEEQSLDLLRRKADEIGYPVLIKAVAGGGGKGMRKVKQPADFDAALASAQREAQAAFGDPRVLIEKYVTAPRHIEIQVFADRHGNVIHLNERDCSLQRRHQKVIEEAPSPLLDDQTRKRMGDQAVALAKAVGYDSAGTVEFVAGQDRSFYFLEMNTRLQVEHPVTELVTGIDLVEQMIRVAAGEPLKLKQSDIRLSGWAVETRIYAEDPYRNFAPSVGRLVRYRPPAEEVRDGITVRNDTGVTEGGEISLYYDPMIAKLVTHAATRLEAIDAQAEALDAFTIEGIRHNIPFLAAIMQHPRWRAGKLSTAFIAEEYPRGFERTPPKGEVAHAIAAVAAAIDHVLGERKRKISGQLNKSVTRERRRAIWLGPDEIHADVEHRADAIVVTFENGARHILASDWAPGMPVWAGTMDGRRIAMHVRMIPNGFELAHRGFEVKAFVYTEREAAYARLMPLKKLSGSEKAVRCPMPGLVVSLAVSEGQEVKTGETLAVIEAMKMENVLRAERDGVIKKIRVKQGDSVAVDAVVMEFA